MRRRHLKPLRVGIALVFLAGLTAAFVDFRGLVPAAAGHWLAAVQFTPALFALGTGTAALVVGIAIVGVTLAFGRVYCSTVCPLGLLQDAVARITAWLRPRRRLRPFARGGVGLRYGVLAAVVLAFAGGAGGIAGAYADPYSNFGRIASGLFRPLLAAANNALVTPATALGFQALYRVVPPWPGPAVFGAALLLLGLVTGLAAWRGRIYCNTLCPVGTVLGLLARGAAFRLTLDRSACTKCAECLRACKAQCLDLRTGTIDAARCVACFNCITACPEQGVGYQFAWIRRSAAPAPVITPPAAGPSRREFMATGISALAAAMGAGRLVAAPAAGGWAPQNFSRAISPPGATSVDRFLERCTACQLCVSACPTHVLQPASLEYGLAGFMKPRLDYAAAFCNFDCRRCGEVCPTGAISRLALEDKQLTRIGLAQLDLDHCIVKTMGTDCAACSEHCPTKAVDTIPYGDNLRLPQVTADLCIGCGACEYACPALPKKAIAVGGRRRHELAVRRVEGKATDPRARGGFPF
jgi:ferredoxin